jgi:protein-S-isoprenylcysteine O-methyltransferase Ste14
MAGKAAAAVGTSIFFAVAPGMVAGVIPWLITRWETGDSLPDWPPVRALGAVLVAAGAVVIVNAFARFVLEGVGTPAPAAPTENLVVGGLYRYVRNPMYLAVDGAIVGQALLLCRAELLIWAAVVTTANAAFVHFYEEPTLHRQFGESYDTYRATVNAWIPRRPA